MKPVERTISDASFIGHYFKLLLTKLKQFKTAKHVVLIGMVLICIIGRYIALLGDKSLNNRLPVVAKHLKLQFHLQKLKPIAANNFFQKNTSYQSQPTQFNFLQQDAHYFMVNDVP